MPRVDRVLIDVDRRNARREQPRLAVRVGGVAERDVGQEPLRHRIGDRRALRLGQHAGIEVDTLQMAQPFVAEEVEGPVLHDRAAEIDAELFAIERRLGVRLGIEEIARVEPVVAIEVERLTVQQVRARPRRHVHDRAGVAAVLGAERGVVDLELRHGVDRRLERDLAVRQVVQVDAVEHEVDGRLAVAGRKERERSLSA
jgi:hypothetical protein